MASSTLLLSTATALPAVADDGEKVLKSTSKEGNELESPIPESEHAFTSMMKFYVPLQAADGTVLSEGVDYLNVDGEVEDTRTLGKPLVNVYHKGPVETVDSVGFIGHGKRDAFASVSLDDGLTWKNTNLSESADKSSSDVVRTDIPLFADTDYAYPGDVVNIFHALAGNKVLVAWPSRFCEGGEPSFSLDSDENADRRAAIAEYLGIDLATASADDLYLLDMYGVSGNQGSVDYIDDKFEQNQAVGEVPFNCLWTARGELVQGDDPRTEAVEETFMRWFNAERLTSGSRDVNRIETMGVAGAGFVITWQEDPEGLRGGQGEGPGEGWSGAVANSQTDVWYSYLDIENFDVVQDPTDDTGLTDMTLAEYEALAAGDGDVTQKPKPFVPFAMPMRLTDNAKCNVTNPQPYCYGDALRGTVDVPTDDQGIVLDPALYGMRDMCSATVEIPTGKDAEPTPVCVTEDGLPMVGNTAATRPRTNLYGYDSDPADEAEGFDSAFVVVQLEEDKGLGRFGYTEDGTPCDPDADDACIAFDEGKNQWYHSFSMSLEDPMVADEDGLLANLADHGNMLNQPEVDWMTGEFYEARDTSTMWDFGEYNFEIYNTEIARRGSLLGQDIYKAEASNEGLLLLPTWKQGTMNQGGPADVMSRRIVLPDDWTVADGNPYAYRNMDCDTWLFEAGENPYYPDGLCGTSAINLSSVIPDTAVDSDGGAVVEPPKVTFGASTFGIGDTNPILQGQEVEPNTTKVTSWHQCPTGWTSVEADEGFDAVTCDSDWREGDGGTTLADQSWYNPLDVAKGHRGYIDGDFVMMLYGWSPNWRLNAKGSDRYELYIRRSFTGATSWGTQPASGTHWDGTTQYSGDGTVTCEIYRDDATETSGELDEPRACYTYPAGADEQARNVTQHKSMRITTLDPRATMTGGPQGVGITADPFGYGIPNYTSGEGDSEDVRDPSRYFVVYETGDNTTTAEGEPEPLDLFYSRAVEFGDEYQVWAETVDECYPSVPHDQDVDEIVEGSGFCNEFDQLEQGIQGLEASEASLAANPGGEFLYATWAQMLHEEEVSVVGASSVASSPAESTEPTWDVTYTVEYTTESEMALAEADAMARRVWWIDGYVSETFGWDFGQGAGAAAVPLAGKVLADAVEAAAEAEGVASVELWVDTPGADEEFVKVDEDTESIDGTFSFTATDGGGTYRFYTIAVIDDGTREEAPADADTQTVYFAEGADVTAPVSEASARKVSNGKPFMVRYKAEDEEGGSGLATVDLYVRVPGAADYELTDTDTGAEINRRFLFTPDAGEGVYRFYTVATDQAGNVEAAPEKADARVRVDTTPPRVSKVKVGPKPFDISRDKALKVKARSSERGDATVRIVDGDGRVVQKLGSKVRNGKLVETWKGRTKAGRLAAEGRYEVVIGVTDNAGNSTIVRRTVRVQR